MYLHQIAAPSHIHNISLSLHLHGSSRVKLPLSLLLLLLISPSSLSCTLITETFVSTKTGEVAVTVDQSILVRRSTCASRLLMVPRHSRRFSNTGADGMSMRISGQGGRKPVFTAGSARQHHKRSQLQRRPFPFRLIATPKAPTQPPSLSSS
jgi:hypothetical protein